MKFFFIHIFVSLAITTQAQNNLSLLNSKFNECTLANKPPYPFIEIKTSGVRFSDDRIGVVIELTTKESNESLRHSVDADTIHLISSKDTLVITSFIKDTVRVGSLFEFFVNRIFIIPLNKNEIQFLQTRDVMSIILVDRFFKRNILIDEQCRKMLQSLIK